ncbi:MAG: helix-turn-helix transcriptional regulator [Pseudobutyrivibrio sp.]|nr:helix-turn-helix transcriptional regulator [Pseudobutyrivibrio sp.]
MFGEILINKGLTIKEVAEGAEIPRSTIADLNSGKTSIDKMSAANLFKLSKYLDVNMEDLYTYCRLPLIKSQEVFVQQENEKILDYGLKIYVKDLFQNHLVETSHALNDQVRFQKYMSAVRDYHKYRMLEMPEKYVDYMVFLEE